MVALPDMLTSSQRVTADSITVHIYVARNTVYDTETFIMENIRQWKNCE